MALLPKPEAPKVERSKGKSKSKTRGKVIAKGKVEPLAGWVVPFTLIEDPSRTSPYNPDGRFYSIQEGAGRPEERSVMRLLLYKALHDEVFGD